MRRNADEDLRNLERAARETRSAADIARYERAATRAGIRRLVSVNELMGPPRVRISEGGISLGHPVQVARVIEVEVLLPRTTRGELALSDRPPDRRSGFGHGRGFTFYVESRVPWAGEPLGEDPTFAFDGLWGRAVDPPEVHYWPEPSERDRGLWPTIMGSSDPDEPERGAEIHTVPVSVPGDWRRLVVTHVYAWTKLPEWAAEAPRVLRTASVTGYMTGFLVGDPIADTRKRKCEERPGQWHASNPGDEDLRRAQRYLDREDPVAVMGLLHKAIRVSDWGLIYWIRRLSYHNTVYRGGRDTRRRASPWHAIYEIIVDLMNESPEHLRHDTLYRESARRFDDEQGGLK